mmetsp:Transcript_19942/g.41672  ORF Transcript_19942/g.41672 Transcript_19942/m.41672 type:complete len:258 (+) Transcript_19942:1370-2143(+)
MSSSLFLNSSAAASSSGFFAGGVSEYFIEKKPCTPVYLAKVFLMVLILVFGFIYTSVELVGDSSFCTGDATAVSPVDICWSICLFLFSSLLPRLLSSLSILFLALLSLLVSVLVSDPPLSTTTSSAPSVVAVSSLIIVGRGGGELASKTVSSLASSSSSLSSSFTPPPTPLPSPPFSFSSVFLSLTGISGPAPPLCITEFPSYALNSPVGVINEGVESASRKLKWKRKVKTVRTRKTRVLHRNILVTFPLSCCGWES